MYFSIFRVPRPSWNPVYTRSLDPSVLAFSLSLHRYPYICIPFKVNSLYSLYSEFTRSFSLYWYPYICIPFTVNSPHENWCIDRILSLEAPSRPSFVSCGSLPFPGSWISERVGNWSSNWSTLYQACDNSYPSHWKHEMKGHTLFSWCVRTDEYWCFLVEEVTSLLCLLVSRMEFFVGSWNTCSCNFFRAVWFTFSNNPI